MPIDPDRCCDGINRCEFCIVAAEYQITLARRRLIEAPVEMVEAPVIQIMEVREDIGFNLHKRRGYFQEDPEDMDDGTERMDVEVTFKEPTTLCHRFHNLSPGQEKNECTMCIVSDVQFNPLLTWVCAYCGIPVPQGSTRPCWVCRAKIEEVNLAKNRRTT